LINYPESSTLGVLRDARGEETRHQRWSFTPAKVPARWITQTLALSRHDQTPAEGRDSQHAFRLWWWGGGRRSVPFTCVQGRLAVGATTGFGLA
jgi:hypothetical protein